jgi:hypothetical protein
MRKLRPLKAYTSGFNEYKRVPRINYSNLI